jgi:hypothetical protein
VRRTGRQRKNISVFSKKDKRQKMKINETKNKQTGEALYHSVQGTSVVKFFTEPNNIMGRENVFNRKSNIGD